MTEIKLGGDILIDARAMTVSRSGTPVPITRREYDILLYLVNAAGRPVSQEELVAEVFPKTVNHNTAEVYISYLRKKLGRDVLMTRRGFGYLLGGLNG